MNPAPETIAILGSTTTALAVARHAWRLGIPALVLDRKRGVACSTRTAEHQVCDDADEADIVQHLCSLAADSRSCLIATEDHWLRFLLANRAVLDAAFDTVLHPTNSALEVCLDKHRFAVWCKSTGLPAPAIWTSDELDDIANARLPVLIRPAQTRHDLPPGLLPKAVEAQTPEELHRWLRRYKQAGATALVAESLLGHRLTQFSVPFARRNDTLVSFVARKLRPPADWCRVGTYVELSPEPEVEALARRAAVALDYNGIGEVEILRSEDDGKDYLIEINARPWLQYSLAVSSGHNLLGVALGDRGIAGSPPRKSGARWLDFWPDLYVCFSRSEGLYTRKRLGLAEYVRSVLQANSFAVFDWRDPAPAIRHFWGTIVRLARRTE